MTFLLLRKFSVAFILILGFSGFVQASTVDFSKCVSLDGQSVKVVSVTADFLKVQTGTQLAASILGNYGVPIIALDMKSLAKLPEQFINFVFFHECGHHQLGHITLHSNIMGKVTRKRNLNREIEADCVSIKALHKELNYDSSDIEVITKTMEKLFSNSYPVDRNGNRVNKGQFRYYKPIDERNELIEKCFDQLEAKKEIKQSA